MKAFIVDRYGKKDGGRIGEMPDPHGWEPKLSALVTLCDQNFAKTQQALTE